MWDLKDNTNGPICETASGTQRTDWQLPRRELGEDQIGSLGLADANWYIQNRQQQGLTGEHQEVYSISCDKPQWKTI